MRTLFALGRGLVVVAFLAGAVGIIFLAAELVVFARNLLTALSVLAGLGS